MAVKKTVEPPITPNIAHLNSEEMEVIKLNQAIINRMSDNSKHTKLLSLINSSLFFFISLQLGINSIVTLIAILITASFWYMDARYLQLEQKFRVLHNDIVNKTIKIENAWLFNPTPYSVDFLKPFTSFPTFMYPLIILSFLTIFVFKASMGY